MLALLLSLLPQAHGQEEPLELRTYDLRALAAVASEQPAVDGGRYDDAADAAGSLAELLRGVVWQSGWEGGDDDSRAGLQLRDGLLRARLPRDQLLLVGRALAALRAELLRSVELQLERYQGSSQQLRELLAADGDAAAQARALGAWKRLSSRRVSLELGVPERSRREQALAHVADVEGAEGEGTQVVIRALEAREASFLRVTRSRVGGPLRVRRERRWQRPVGEPRRFASGQAPHHRLELPRLRTGAWCGDAELAPGGLALLGAQRRGDAIVLELVRDRSAAESAVPAPGTRSRLFDVRALVRAREDDWGRQSGRFALLGGDRWPAAAWQPLRPPLLADELGSELQRHLGDEAQVESCAALLLVTSDRPALLKKAAAWVTARLAQRRRAATVHLRLLPRSSWGGDPPFTPSGSKALAAARATPTRSLQLEAMVRCEHGEPARIHEGDRSLFVKGYHSRWGEQRAVLGSAEQGVRAIVQAAPGAGGKLRVQLLFEVASLADDPFRPRRWRKGSRLRVQRPRASRQRCAVSVELEPGAERLVQLPIGALWIQARP